MTNRICFSITLASLVVMLPWSLQGASLEKYQVPKELRSYSPKAAIPLAPQLVKPDVYEDFRKKITALNDEERADLLNHYLTQQSAAKDKKKWKAFLYYNRLLEIVALSFLELK